PVRPLAAGARTSSPGNVGPAPRLDRAVCRTAGTPVGIATDPRSGVVQQWVARGALPDDPRVRDPQRAALPGGGRSGAWRVGCTYRRGSPKLAGVAGETPPRLGTLCGPTAGDRSSPRAELQPTPHPQAQQATWR